MFSRSCHQLSRSIGSCKPLLTSKSCSTLVVPPKKVLKPSGSRRRRSIPPGRQPPAAKGEGVAKVQTTFEKQADVPVEPSSLESRWPDCSEEKGLEHQLVQVITCIHLLPLILDSITLRKLFWKSGVRVLEAWKPVGKRSGMIQTSLIDQKRILRQMNRKPMSWGILEAESAGLATTTIELSPSEDISFELVSGRIEYLPNENDQKTSSQPSPPTSPSPSPSTPPSPNPPITPTPLPVKKEPNTQIKKSPITTPKRRKVSNLNKKSPPKVETKPEKAPISLPKRDPPPHIVSVKAKAPMPAGTLPKHIQRGPPPLPKHQKSFVKATVVVAAADRTPKPNDTPRRPLDNPRRGLGYGLSHAVKNVPLTDKKDKFEIKTSSEKKTDNKQKPSGSATSNGSINSKELKMRSRPSSPSPSAEEKRKSNILSKERYKAMQKLLTSVYEADTMPKKTTKPALLPTGQSARRRRPTKDNRQTN